MAAEIGLAHVPFIHMQRVGTEKWGDQIDLA